MKIASLLLVALTVLLAAAAEPPPARETLEMLDSPGGRVTAVLLPGTPTKILEQREGYARVVVEGWIRMPAGGSVAREPGPNTAPAPASPPAAPALPALSGQIETGSSSSERRPAAYARVTLLAASEELDRDREALGREYRSDRESLARRIGELEAAGKSALNSNDNMTEAARRADQIRAELARRRKELAEVDTRYAVRAGELYRKHQVAETVADPGGHYVFPTVPAGRYRLAVATGDSASIRRWYVPAEVPAGGGGRVDLIGGEAENPPF